MGRAHDGVAGRAALVRARACRRHPAQFPRTRTGEDRASVVRHLRPLGASHAAGGRHRARRLGGERLRRARAQHHGDGRRVDRPRHCRKRRYLAAVCALRTGVGGRACSAARPCRASIGAQGRSTGSGRGWPAIASRRAGARRSGWRRARARVALAPPAESRRRRAKRPRSKREFGKRPRGKRGGRGRRPRAAEEPAPTGD